MSQITGALTLELDLDRLAQRVADLVVAQLTNHGAQHRVSDVYEREQEPDTDRLRGRGARYGAVADGGLQLDGDQA